MADVEVIATSYSNGDTYIAYKTLYCPCSGGKQQSMDLKELQSNEFRGRENEGDACPDCLQGQLRKRENRTDHSEFLGCDRWPECNYTISL